MYIHLNVDITIYVYSRIISYICMYVYLTCANLYACMYVDIYACIAINIFLIHIHPCRNIYMSVHTHIHTDMHICISYIDINILYIHMYDYVQYVYA